MEHKIGSCKLRLTFVLFACIHVSESDQIDKLFMAKPCNNILALQQYLFHANWHLFDYISISYNLQVKAVLQS